MFVTVVARNLDKIWHIFDEKLELFDGISGLEYLSNFK